MKQLNVETRGEVPVGVVKLANRRTVDLVAFYGRHIQTTTIQELASSCYVQGVEDAFTTVCGPTRPAQPSTPWENLQ